MGQDIFHAFRTLRQNLGWTIVVLLSLALGIGANATIFTAVNGVLLQTVPVPAPESMVRLKWVGDNDMVRSSSDYGFNTPVDGKNTRATFSFATYQALRDGNHTLTDLFAGAPFGRVNVVVDGQADLASAFAVTGNYYRVLQVPAEVGRVLGDADDQPGAPPAAVISAGFWKRRFGGDPNIAGRTVTINNKPFTIVGVTPEWFIGVQGLQVTAPDLTFALALDAMFTTTGPSRLAQPTNWWLQIQGRLKPGVTLAQVAGNFEGVFQQSARAGMESYMAGLTAEQRNLSTNKRDRTAMPRLLAQSASRGEYDLDTNSIRSASILSVVVLLVLLIVCANVANLLLSRAASRRPEIAVRLSLGATRGRLVRQLLTESIVLSGLGGLLGILIGNWSRSLLPFGQNAPIDWRVIAFVAGVSILTGVMFGLLPALRATGVDLAGVMKENSRSVVSTRTWASRVLLVVQVALSIVLLVGAGLFLRTVQNLRHVDIGFNPDNLLVFAFDPSLNQYEQPRVQQIMIDARDALKGLPGVRAVALTRVAVLSGGTSSSSVYVEGATKDKNVYVMSVSPEFFSTMEIPVLSGRAFTDHDGLNAPKVAIINETAARLLYPNENPVGRRVGFELEKSSEIEIVGVVRDTKYNSLRDAAPPTMYSAYLQGPVRRMYAVVRSSGDPRNLIEPVRAAMRRVDANMPLTNIATQTENIEGRFAQERLLASAYALFGGLALLLASIGLFGLMSYNVARRQNEIGIRMALGAQQRQVLWMVLSESFLLVGSGVAIGLAAAIFAGRYVQTLLFELPTTDIPAIATAVGLVLALSALGGYLPARRASRVDPMIALHRS